MGRIIEPRIRFISKINQKRKSKIEKKEKIIAKP